MQSGGLKINNDDGIRSQLRLPEILIIRNHFLNVMAVIYRVRKWAQFIKLTLIARRKQSGTKIDKCLTTPVKTGNSVVLTFLGTIWQNYLEAWNLKNPIRQRHLNLPFPSRMPIQRPHWFRYSKNKCFNKLLRKYSSSNTTTSETMNFK